MAYTPTYVFTPVTYARASEVNQNFSELDSYFLLLTGGTLVGNLIFTDGAATPETTISLDNLTGKVTMDQLVLDPQSATPTSEEGKVFFNDNDKKIYYYNGSSWQEMGQDATGSNDGPFYIFDPQSATPTPVEGKVYYDDLLNQLHYYDGSTWVPVGSAEADYFDFNPQAATPSAVEGRVYYDDLSNQLYYYNGTDWKPISSSGRYETSFTNETSITVTHNLDTKYVGWVVYDSSDEIIVPNEVTAIDENNLKFDFAVSESGTIVIYGEASGISYIPVLDTDLIPDLDNAHDIGSSGKKWKDGYFAGKLTVDGGIDPEYLQLDPQAGDGAILNNSLFVDSSDSNKLKFKDNSAVSDAVVTEILLATPTISNFTSSQHTHADAANGGSVDHGDLVNTHNLTTDIDHNTLTNNHNLTTDIDHNSLTNNHNLTTDIDHVNIQNKGTTTHADIDLHIGSSANPHTGTLDQVYTAGQSITVDSGAVAISCTTTTAAVDITHNAASGTGLVVRGDGTSNADYTINTWNTGTGFTIGASDGTSNNVVKIAEGGQATNKETLNVYRNYASAATAAPVATFTNDNSGDDTAVALMNQDAAAPTLSFGGADATSGDIQFRLRTSDPSSPTEGEVWYNSTDHQLKLYDGTQVVIVG